MSPWPEESQGDPEEPIYVFDEATTPDEGVHFIGESVEPLIACWRCGKHVAASVVTCLFCHARLAPESPTAASLTSQRQSTPIVTMLWLYAALIVTSVIWGCFCRFGLVVQNARDVEPMFQSMLGIEAIDTVLVAITCIAVRPPKFQWWQGWTQAVLAWLGGVFLLLVMLGVNLGYHTLLREFLHAPNVKDEIVAIKGLSLVVIGALCIQPAVVEELFFRYVALGHLRAHMGTHAAVLVSGVMFGVAHLGQPLSVPVLILIGIGLGYARTWGGTLLLPMFLHFLHNFVVTYLDAVS